MRPVVLAEAHHIGLSLPYNDTYIDKLEYSCGLWGLQIYLC